MILTHFLFSTPLDFSLQKAHMLVFENPGDYGRMISELYAQTRGLTGSFELYEDGESIDISKHMMLVTDPISIDCNSKQILTGFISHINSICMGPDNYVEVKELLDGLQKTLLDITSGEELDSTLSEPGVGALLKLMDLRLIQSPDLAERASEYVRLVSKYTLCRLVVIAGLGGMLSKDLIRNKC